MWLPFRKEKERDLEVYLHVELGFQSARLADLVQLLAAVQSHNYGPVFGQVGLHLRNARTMG